MFYTADECGTPPCPFLITGFDLTTPTFTVDGKSVTNVLMRAAGPAVGTIDGNGQFQIPVGRMSVSVNFHVDGSPGSITLTNTLVPVFGTADPGMDTFQIAGIFNQDDVTASLDLRGFHDNLPPTAQFSPTGNIECNVPFGAEITLNGLSSTDPDGSGDIIEYFWRLDGNPSGAGALLPVALPLGDTVVRLRVYDAHLAFDDETKTLSVIDTTRPDIDCPEDVFVTCGESTDPADTGTAAATDICDPAPVVEYSDVVIPTTSPADPIQEVIKRTWTATDASSNRAECVQTNTVLKKVFELDIKPGSCPNSYNRDSRGVLPVGLLGTADFDVTTVDLASLLISRADSVGGAEAPHEGPPGPRTRITDVGTPFPGEPCACHELVGDGIDDLSLKFRVTEMVEALQLNGLPNGALPELCVTGSLNDGSFAPSGERCEFIACDCVRLVPPGTAGATAFIASTVSGAWIDVSPLDLTLDGGGFADFERRLPETTEVTLTASDWHSTTSETDSEAETSSRFWFTGWRLDGEILPETGLTLAVELSASMQIEAVYEAQVAPISAPAPHDIPKNRFISVDPNNPGAVSLRVELLDLACSVTGRNCNSSTDCKACVEGGNAGDGCSIHSDCAGGTCVLSGETCEEQSPPVLLGWMSDPVEAGGDALPGTFTSEVVTTQPAPRTWTESVVHIGDCEIAPVRTYGISATANGTLFSDPLIVGTIEKPQGKFWGDIVGNFNGIEWSAPNGLVGVDDVNAMIKFLTLKPAPHITVVDLVGSAPTFVNFDVNATDLQMVLEAFGAGTWPPLALTGIGYPADGDVTFCP